jgi:phospholipid/cholesterol/gamma-HCH transport system substrate-binding protein
VKHLREYPPVVVGLVSAVVLTGLILGALNYTSLPLINHTVTVRADFANSGGLTSDDIVTVAGVRVGRITKVALDGDQVQVTLAVRPGLGLASQTTAAVKVLSPIGTEYLELTPQGPGSLQGAIPQARTSVPYTIVDTLSTLASNTQAYNITNLETAMRVASQDLAGTPAQVTSAALEGLARFSAILGSRQQDLATIVTQGSGLAQAISSRSGQLFDLIGQGNLVLQVLQQRRAAIQQLLTGTAALSGEVSSILSSQHLPLESLLANLETVTGLLSRDSADIGQAIPLLAGLSRYVANATGSGPFVDAAIPTTLIPDNLIAACANAANYPSTNAQVGCRP